jgi:hypothetical protein
MKELIVSPVYNSKGNIVGQEYHGELIRCKECKFHHDRTQCSIRIGAWFDDDYCNGAVRAERKEE